MREFLSGITDSQLAQHRDGLRAVTVQVALNFLQWELDFLLVENGISQPSPVQDLVTVCEKYLVEPALCGKALIGGANKNLDEMGWKVHQQ